MNLYSFINSTTIVYKNLHNIKKQRAKQNALLVFVNLISYFWLLNKPKQYHRSLGGARQGLSDLILKTKAKNLWWNQAGSEYVKKKFRESKAGF